jgi:hypothetical protein|tara:strand:- start:44 stop:1024 length:981 start_codon:yes stop_codon:yes gene_type:complete
MLNLTIPKMVERPTQRELATTFMHDILGGSNWHVVIDKDYPGVPRLMYDTFLYRYYIREEYADRDPVVWEDEDGHTLMWGIRQILRTIPERDSRVLLSNYGLSNGSPETLVSIGKREGISGAFAAHIRNRGLRKLRHPTRLKILEPFLYLYNSSDKRAGIARWELHGLLSEVYPKQFAYDLVMRLRRRYMADAFRAVKSNSFRQLGRLVAYSCSLQLGICDLCGDPALPSSNWCLAHLNLKNKIVAICDGCGIKFGRDPSQLLAFSKTHGRTQHGIFHDKACFFKHGSRVGVFAKRVSKAKETNGTTSRKPVRRIPRSNETRRATA